MRLLIVTQAADSEDPVLGFFVRWIEELAKRFERVEVVCLKEGKHALPANACVHSLGKERGARVRAAYAARFLSLAWHLRGEYDVVFVHMNQEYVLLAGWLWKLLGKRVYMWRNHYAGSLLTDIAALFCAKVFCTSKHSYTARYKRTVLMPVGVDLEKFHPDASGYRAENSILFFARIAPSKRPDMFIEALGLLLAKGVRFTASLYGSPLPEDKAYYERLKRRAGALGLNVSLAFHPGVPHDQAVRIFQSHEIFVNCSPSGMLDKTLFEAAACGCAVLTASEDFAELSGQLPAFDSAAQLADLLGERLKDRRTEELPVFVKENSLDKTVQALFSEMNFADPASMLELYLNLRKSPILINRLLKFLRNPGKYISHQAYKLHINKFADRTILTCFNSRMTIPLWDQNAVVLYYTGTLAPEELAMTRYFLNELTPRDVFYDVGANFGYFSSLGNLVDARVHAFEPNPTIIPYLKKNVSGNVIINELALNDSEGVVQFYDMSLSGKSGTSSLVSPKSPSREIKVRSLTLDSYTRVNEPPTLLKIDVEGREYAVLSGGRKMLERYSPIVVIEALRGERSENLARSLRLLKELGYRPFWIGHGGRLRPGMPDTALNLVFKRSE
jgi:FkbM family methyltransferase